MTTQNTSELLTLSPSQLAELLAATIPAKLPVLITGKPGIGKTDIVKQAAAAAGADLIVTHPVVSDPTDFKGLPAVAADKVSATFLPFGDLKLLMTAKKLTVAFFDDLGQAPAAVQAACMQLFLARHINGHKISDHIVFVGATNRRSDRAGVQGILEPVKSRFATIVELDTSANDFCTWAVQANIAPEVIAFIRFRPELLSNFKPSADMVNSPSPRTWERVSQLLALTLKPHAQMVSFQGAVGREAATEFTAFLRIWQQMVSPDLILTSPDTAPIPSEPSALYAVATALAVRVAAPSMARYCRYLERLSDADQAEFAAVSLKMAVAREPKLTNTSGYVKAMSGSLGELMVGS